MGFKTQEEYLAYKSLRLDDHETDDGIEKDRYDGWIPKGYDDPSRL